MFKKTLLALATTAALASAVPAFAASFYLTIPMAARGTAPIGNVSVNLADGTLANAMVGEPYSATVKNHLSVTGDEGFNFNRVGWNVSTGALPAGLDFNVTTGAITGTPTAPGANTFGITATYRGKADEGMFNLSVMEILLALQNNTLPAGQIGAEYSAGLQNFLTVTGDQAFNGSNVGWSFTSGSLPAGLTLNAATGEITGTPTGPASAPFVVSATYRGKTASGTYSVSVLDITVNLAAATLPAATVNTAYSANLATNFTVANDASFTPGTTPVNWALSSGTLPAGLTLSAAGLVAGTPSARTTGTGASFQVKASYKGKDGQQTYTIVVGGNTLQVSSISLGDHHTCAITTSKELKCWGMNNSGQLGDGTTTRSLTPKLVPGLTNVTSVELGPDNSCAVASGTLYCWGNNSYGRLGDGTTINRSSPVATQTGITAVSMNAFHGCSLSTAGAVKCWGSSSYGQTGTSGTVYTPFQVPGLTSGVSAIASGDYTACAIQNGGMLCWGYNGEGQLGNNTAAHGSIPTYVTGLNSGVANISVGYHTCAVLTSGAAKCWGYNVYGALGDGGSATAYAPVQVVGLTSGVANIAVGFHNTCVTLDSGAVKCWGQGDTGQIGNSATNSVSTPTQVTGITSGALSVAVGRSSACAILSSGALQCWGYNSNGQLGDGTTTNKSTPTPVTGF